MRTVKVFESISVDGYFADANGEMGFAHAVPRDAAFDGWVAENAGGDSELLFGRTTLEQMQGFWTSPMAREHMPDVARKMNTARKYVASRTHVPTWENTTRLEGDLIEAVRALKNERGPALVVLGSGSIVSQLGAAGLVDEYQLVIIPTALGSGRALFSAPKPLRLVSQRAFDNGNVVVTYGPEGTVTPDGPTHSTLTFLRAYRHRPEHVWDALTTPEGLRAWLLCSHVALEPRLHGRITLVSGPAQYRSEGMILSWDPPRLFEYEWNVQPVPEMPAGERAIFRYDLHWDGALTRLTVVYRRLTREVARGFVVGLHVLLDRLQAQLDGDAMPDFLPAFEAMRAHYPAWSHDAPAPGK